MTVPWRPSRSVRKGGGFAGRQRADHCAAWLVALNPVSCALKPALAHGDFEVRAVPIERQVGPAIHRALIRKAGGRIHVAGHSHRTQIVVECTAMEERCLAAGSEPEARPRRGCPGNASIAQQAALVKLTGMGGPLFPSTIWISLAALKPCRRKSTRRQRSVTSIACRHRRSILA